MKGWGQKGLPTTSPAEVMGADGVPELERGPGPGTQGHVPPGEPQGLSGGPGLSGPVRLRVEPWARGTQICRVSGSSSVC